MEGGEVSSLSMSLRSTYWYMIVGVWSIEGGTRRSWNKDSVNLEFGWIRGDVANNGFLNCKVQLCRNSVRAGTTGISKNGIYNPALPEPFYHSTILCSALFWQEAGGLNRSRLPPREIVSLSVNAFCSPNTDFLTSPKHLPPRKPIVPPLTSLHY